MQFRKTPLPYAKDALEPYVSRATMEFHYNRHYAGYVDKLNQLTRNTDYEDLDLESTIIQARDRGDTDILRNAGQVWNHEFFFQSLSPNGGSPDGAISDVLKSAFASVDKFKAAFSEAAADQFGSGWVWFVFDRGQPKIVSGSNAETPVGTEAIPLLVLDVWEHAYYLDYQNERDRFTDQFLDHLVNWNFAAANLKHAVSGKAA